MNKQELIAAIKNKDWESIVDYLVDLIPDEKEYEVVGFRVDALDLNPGDELIESRVWDDGTPTEEYLDGTCAVEIASDWYYYSRERLIDGFKMNLRHMISYLPLGNLYVIYGDNCEGGEDLGEIIIKNAKVLAKII